MIIDKIWLSKEAPNSTRLLWLRPIYKNGAKGIALYAFNNGRWETLSLANSKNTSTLNDDEPVNVTNIGGKVNTLSLDDIQQAYEESNNSQS